MVEIAVNLALGISTLALALAVVALASLRRRPPKALALLLPLLAWMAAGEEGGKPLALLLLAINACTLKALVFSKALRAAQSCRPVRLMSLGLGVVTALCLWSLAWPMTIGWVDRLLVAVVTLPLSLVLGQFALPRLVLPALTRKQGYMEALKVAQGDTWLVNGRCFFEPCWFWPKKSPATRQKVRLRLALGPFDCVRVTEVTVLGSGYELASGASLEAEFVEGEEDLTPEPKPAASEPPRRMMRAAKITFGLLGALLVVEALVLVWAMMYKGLMSYGAALAFGALLVVLVGLFAYLPYALMLRLGKAKPKD